MLGGGPVRIFRLTNEPGGLGLSCTPEGVSLAGVPLVCKTRTGFVARPAAEISSLLKTAYGDRPVALPSRLESRLGAITQALNGAISPMPLSLRFTPRHRSSVPRPPPGSRRPIRN